MKGSLHAGIAQKNSGIAQKNVTIAQSQLIKQYNTTIKQVNDNDEKTEIDRRTAILSTLYSNNIGAIKQMTGEILKDIAETYPDETWYPAAFEIAVKNNARNLAYIETVLRNWQDKGRDWAPKMSYNKQGTLQQTPTLEEALAKAGYQ
jgi:DnaD/phage-associated family protein